MSMDSPIMMQMPGELRFSARGEWFHDGVLVEHQGVSQYLSKHLKRIETDYVVEVSGKAVRVVVEDAPFVVRTIDLESQQILLNEGSVEEFRPETLSSINDERLYLRVKGDKYWAFLLSPALQALMPFFENEGEGFRFRFGSKTYPIKQIKELKETPSRGS